MTISVRLTNKKLGEKMSIVTGILLAAGQGKRMKSNMAKQYLLLKEKPILAYTIEAFETSKIDQIIIVCPHKDIDYCKVEIVEKYNFTKVTKVIEGGKERYDSVFQALLQCGDTDYVLIHDGVRPLIQREQINFCIENVKSYPACVLGVPLKDTVKIVEQDGFVEKTLDRSRLWSIQTPQAFDYEMIFKAYKSYLSSGMTNATDDSSILELFSNLKVKILMGDYSNIKITTSEDLCMAEAILDSRQT